MKGQSAKSEPTTTHTPVNTSKKRLLDSLSESVVQQTIMYKQAIFWEENHYDSPVLLSHSQSRVSLAPQVSMISRQTR